MTIRKAEALGSRHPRPTSVGQSNILAGGKSSRLEVISGNPEEKINAILRQEKPLLEEALEGLVKSLKLPLPSEKNAPSHPQGSHVSCSPRQHGLWVKEIKKKHSKMIIAAVNESQSLPGFITNDSGRFFNKLLLGGTGPAYSIDDLLNFLNKVYRTMNCYFMEQSIVNQVLTEILKMTGIMAFNGLLMRKNFSSWKRAMQIQYNITRIEERRKSHGIPEGTLHLEHLMQATKLLQFKKATLEDIENIYDVCWILPPTQIQKLISQYHVADYENPISPVILRAVAARVVSGDKGDLLLLDSVSMDETTVPCEIPGPRETKPYLYLPAWLNLKRIRRLTLLESVLAERDGQQSDSTASTAMAS